MARPVPRELQERRQLVSDQRNRLEQRLGHAADAGAGAESLGLYRQATQLALLPAGFLSNPVSTVAQPALIVLLDDA